MKSINWNTSAHKKANITVIQYPYIAPKTERLSADGVTIIVEEGKKQRFPYGRTEVGQASRKEAYERLAERNKINKQVKEDLGIEFEVTYEGFKTSEHDKDWYADWWTITGKGDFKMRYGTGVGRRMYFWGGYGQGALEAYIVPPSAMDILYSVQVENPHDETFETWCDEFGYDPDSRKAEKVYNACVQQAMMFRRNYPGVNLDDYEPLQNW